MSIDIDRLARAIHAVQAPIYKRHSGTGDTAVKVRAGQIGAAKRWGQPALELARKIAAEYERLTP